MKANILFEKNRSFFPNDISALYEYQTKAIEKIMQNKNTLSIVPTGGGKSLIYQLSGMELDGITLVISPLLALMKEQVDQLNLRGANVISITSNMGFSTQRDVLRNLNKIKPRLIYVSPERLQDYFFKYALINSNLPISLIAIDEAHCISQWGIEFRPEYAQIKSFVNFLRKYGQNPILFALTATLSLKARKDIVEEFEIEKDNIIIDKNIIRNELNLEFRKVKKEDEKVNATIEFLNKYNCKKTIVYLYDRKKCEELSSLFNNLGYSTSFFHADMDYNSKSESYELFLEGKYTILFATTAFGMGMNIPDIDSVIHYHIPNSVEEYYQQVGRAARKKNICPKANCLVLWSDENIKVRKRRIAKGAYNIEKLILAVRSFGLENKKGKICSISYTYYKDSELNLPLLRFLFEKYGLFEVVGDLNGSPGTIKFKSTTPFWLKVMKYSDDIVDSFKIASEDGNIPFLDILDFIHKEDLQNNIEFMPAKDKNLYYFSNINRIPTRTLEKIKLDFDKVVKFKIDQFEKFVGLLEIKSKRERISHIKNILGVT